MIEALLALPDQVQEVLDQADQIAEIGERYAHYSHMFVLGRRNLYPTALEAALKLKEMTYINANGYPAGELKHGPLALIDENCPTIALCTNRETYPKMLSNLMEVRARQGKILAIVDALDPEIEQIADDVIQVPAAHPLLAPVLSIVAVQLLAYAIAQIRGVAVDQPRNLAKSVTVE